MKRLRIHLLLGILILIWMVGCANSHRQQELRERQEVREEIREKDSLAAQDSIDELIEFTDSIRRAHHW